MAQLATPQLGSLRGGIWFLLQFSQLAVAVVAACGLLLPAVPCLAWLAIASPDGGNGRGVSSQALASAYVVDGQIAYFKLHYITRL